MRGGVGWGGGGMMSTFNRNSSSSSSITARLPLPHCQYSLRVPSDGIPTGTRGFSRKQYWQSSFPSVEEAKPSQMVSCCGNKSTTQCVNRHIFALPPRSIVQHTHESKPAANRSPEKWALCPPPPPTMSVLVIFSLCLYFVFVCLSFFLFLVWLYRMGVFRMKDCSPH